MKRDFEKFFTKLQLDYNSMLKQKDRIDKEYGENLLSIEQYNSFLNYFNLVKTNYDRMNYARYLLHKPPKFIEYILNKISNIEASKLLDEYKKLKADEESILKENKEALDEVSKGDANE